MSLDTGKSSLLEELENLEKSAETKTAIDEPQESEKENIAPFVENEPVAADTVQSKRMRKKCDKPLNIRSGPAFSFPPIDLITSKEKIFNITKEENNFGCIDDKERWVCLDFMEEI